MNKIATIILCFLCFHSFAGKTTFEKLCEVNKCWKDQADVAPDGLPAYHTQSEREWIRTHLSIVEQVLRSRNTENLSAAQRQNRSQCLDHLHTYWLAGNFPQNEDYAYRTPIFIDKHDNFCAVGYLVKASGHEDVSRMIAAKTNLAYVKEMKYPELTAWAQTNGFNVDELAWIQPGYPPSHACEKMGEGVDGEVKEMYVDASTGRLYVGGSFVNVDNTIVANNIAYVTEDGGNYTWHSMGQGVNGKVYAILKYGDNIFVGGHFSEAGGNAVDNIAYWDGSTWHSAGCIDGWIYNMVIYKGGLYACGYFKTCGTIEYTNFARWNGTSWDAIIGVSGYINTMQVVGSKLAMGGNMLYGSTISRAVMWDDVAGYSRFANELQNDVKDFEVFQDTLYASCEFTSAADSVNLLMKLVNGTWKPGFKYEGEGASIHGEAGAKTINTLCTDGNSLSLGGQFYTAPMIGTAFSNTYGLGFNDNMVWVDSEVNKMVVYKNSLIVGGKFKNGNGAFWGHVAVNGIAKRSGGPTAVPTSPGTTASFSVYPDPVSVSGTLTIENNMSANHYVLRDMTGRLQASGAIKNTTEKIIVPSVAQGIYLMELSNDQGEHVSRKVVIE